jgi:hypothetical protein
MHLTKWRQERFVRALFPRDLRLRPDVKLFGEDRPAVEPFKARVDTVYATVPAFLRNFFHDAGYMFRLALRLGHIDPDYAMQDPEYARGATYEHTASGSLVPNKLAIDLPEVSLGRIDVFDPKPHLAHATDEELACTIAHEIWHGIEMALDGYADSPAIRKAYAADLADIMDRKIQRKKVPNLHYFLPQSHGGKHGLLGVAREEALVEIGAELSLKARGYKAGHVHLSMPNMALEVGRLINALRKDCAVMPTGLEFPWGPKIDRVLRARRTPDEPKARL